MNTPGRNDKNIAKMQAIQEAGRIYSDSDEDRNREEQQRTALEEATREYPLPTVRRGVIVACVVLWVFCFGGLLFGLDLRGIFPFLFVMLAMLILVHVPIFWLKKKIIDVVIAIAFATGCFALAISLITGL
jgi:hypothetical protein